MGDLSPNGVMLQLNSGASGPDPPAPGSAAANSAIMDNVARLSADEKRLLRKTWTIVSKDLNDIGGKIFEMIFAQSPDTKMLFPFTKTNHGKNEKVSKDIQFHGLRFMQILESMIQALDRPRDLEPLLDNLGRRHGRLTEKTSFRPHHWAVFIECTLFHFRTLISNDSYFANDIVKTDRAIILWRIVLKSIIKRMKVGLNQDLRNRKSNREFKINTNLQNGIDKLSLNSSAIFSPPSKVGSKSSIDSTASHSPVY